MRASEHEPVRPGAFHARQVSLQETAGLRSVETTMLDGFLQTPAPDRDHTDPLRVFVDKGLQGAAPGGRGRTDDRDGSGPGRGGCGLHCGDRADERYGELRPKMRDGIACRRVACDDHQLDPPPEEEPADALGQQFELASGLPAVRNVALVRDEDEPFVRQSFPQFAQHRQSADPGVKDPDRIVPPVS